MATVLFDTLSLSRTLRDKGHFTPEQAETLAEAFSEATHEDLATKADFLVLEAAFKSEIGIVKAEIGSMRAKIDSVEAEMANLATKAEMANLATKAELAEVRAELKTELAEVKAELKTDIAELKAELKTDIAEVKAAIAEVKADILRWMVGAIGFQTVAPLWTVIALVRIFA